MLNNLIPVVCFLLDNFPASEFYKLSVGLLRLKLHSTRRGLFLVAY